MNELEWDALYAQIDNFLREAARQHLVPNPCSERRLAFWRCHTSLTASEIDMLATLMRSPARAETVAHLLGRNLAATAEFLDALEAIGVLERRGNRYHTTPATEQYLQAFLDRPPGWTKSS